MDISLVELKRLDFYRASELHGGLLLGQLVRRVRDPELMLELTRHAAEEIVHAQLWTETILEVGGRPRPVRQTYQSRYAEHVGHALGVLDVLALTQVFERRVYRHFLDHARMPGTHPAVRRTLLRMVEEEKAHLSWVKRWLDEQALHRPVAVREAMTRYAEIDQLIYDDLVVEYSFRTAA
jgi:demethoxyubiquinone hydroxylase (CLK1/Coq7/Cat5 family)